MQGVKGTGQRVGKQECSRCQQVKKLKARHMCHNCYHLTRMAESEEYAAKWKVWHVEKNRAYYKANAERLREKARVKYHERTGRGEYIPRKTKRRVQQNRTESQPARDAGLPVLGPCLLCNDRYRDHSLCMVVLEAREGLKRRANVSS